MIYYTILIRWYKRYRAQIPCRDSLCACVCVCVCVCVRTHMCVRVPFTYDIDSVTIKGKYHAVQRRAYSSKTEKYAPFISPSHIT